MGSARTSTKPSTLRARVRFLGSWALALILLLVAVPRVLDVSWHGIVPALTSVRWPTALELFGLWLLGLVVHSFVLTAAAPKLTHARALTLNMTGSAVSNVVPLGGAAGIELNRRMMKAWGIGARTFTGYTFLTNLWDVASKLVLPVFAVAALVGAGQHVVPQLRTAAILAGPGFLILVTLAVLLFWRPGTVLALGRAVERLVRGGLRLVGRDRPLGLDTALYEIRRECLEVVASGWLRMTAGISGYVALQWLLLMVCLHGAAPGVTWPAALAGFAVERLLTVVPLTPGGVGIADLGMVGVLVALGGDPVGAAAAAVLYRAFIFLVEIPVGGGVLGLWLLRQRGRRPASGRARSGAVNRVGHVTDVFLPRLGGIETHVDDLVRHQRDRGLDAEVLTPTAAGTDTADDPGWVRRVPAAQARAAIADYDVVHVHVSLWSPYAVGVARAAMAAGVPVLVTVHSMWSGAGGLLRLAALTSIRRWPVVWSAVSSAAADAFGRSLGGAEVAVLPNAIDVGEWRRPAGAAQTSDGAITLVSVMRLMPRKRPLQLLSAFDELTRLVPDHDVRLVVVGDGPLRRRMERFAARRGLADRVTITGRVPREQVLEELRAASIYVAPADMESFGIAALEARCAGLPVVASRRSGVAEFVRDRRDGLLVGSDAELVAALATLVSDDRLRSRIAAHNRRVAPAFDWSDALARTDELYRVALGRARRADQATTPAALPVGA